MNFPEFLGRGVHAISAELHSMLPPHLQPEGRGAIHAASAGADELKHATPAILVPGYFGTPEYLEPMRRSLARDNFHAYTFEVPRYGVGDAHKAGTALARYAREVSAKHGGAPVILAGHSRGGMIALDATANHLKPGEVAGLIAMQSPLNGKHVSAVSRVMAKSPITDLLVPDGSMEQLLAGSDYVKAIWKRDISRDGAHLVSIFRDKSDWLVTPKDAHVRSEGWTNIPFNSPGSPGDFKHLTMVTHNGDFYERTLAEFNRAALQAR